MAGVIADYVREEYTGSGVGVASQGKYNVVLELPADYAGLSDLVVALSTQFNAVCDLNTTHKAPRLTVWLEPHVQPALPAELPAVARCSLQHVAAGSTAIIGLVILILVYS